MSFDYDSWAIGIIDRLPQYQDEREPIIEQREPLEEEGLYGFPEELDDRELDLSSIDVDDLWSQEAPESSQIPIIEISDDDFSSNVRQGNRRGFEAWAFYKSIHFLRRPPFPGRWGIFLLDSGLEMESS